jgi:hypothetical protein
MEIESPGGETSNKTLNNSVAITVVVISVFMALQGIKAGNVAQAIEQTKSDVLNKWSQYQASRLKHDLVLASQSTNRLVAATPGIDAALVAEETAKADKAAAFYTEREKKYLEEAKELEGKLEALNKRDDQFDVADAMASLALALAAIAILAESWPLLFLAWGFGGFALTMGGAAMAGYSLYPQWLVDILT